MNWTLVATSAISALAALFGGLIGFLGSRLRTRAEMARLEAEIKRAETERRDALMGRRGQLYEQYLGLADRATRNPSAVLRQTRANEKFNEDFSVLHARVVLSGGPMVREMADTLNTTTAEYLQVRAGSREGDPTIKGLAARSAWYSTADAMRAELDALVPDEPSGEHLTENQG